MREEIRQRYERWIGKPGERIKIAPLAREDYFLGGILKQMREYLRIPLELMAEGICNRSELDVMERGAKANWLVANIYLGRMGRSIGKFEFYFTEEEYQRLDKRNLIKKLWREDHLEDAEGLLAEYAGEEDTKYARYWRSWQENCIALRRGKLPENHKKIWEELEKQCLYFLPEELDYLYELADFYQCRQEEMRARKVYALMYQNAMMKGFLPGEEGKMDEERGLEVLPKLCLQYGHFERMQGQYLEAVQILDVALLLLCRCMRTEMRRELIEERIAAMRGEQEEAGGTKQEIRDLLTLDLVCGNIKDAEKRLCRLKEEEWGNTILERLSAVLEKLSD